MNNREKIEKITKYYRLDRSADIYPMSTTRTVQSNFRIAAELVDVIDEAVLARAVNKALDRYPSYRVQLRRGVFRYYLEKNNSKPRVWQDNGIEFEPIDYYRNNRFLFRIKVYKKDISMDFFHGLADGLGAVEFLKTIIYTYYEMMGIELGEPINIRRAEDPVDKSEFADDIHKYYKKFKLNDPVIQRMIGKNCYGISDKKFKGPGYALMQVAMDSRKVLEVARSFDSSITELLAGILLLCINNVFKNPKGKELVAMIPVNLRKLFPSNTLHNFTTMVRCPVNPKEVNADIKSYVHAVRNKLRVMASDVDGLQAQLSLSALFSKNPLTKMFPVALKTLFVKFPKLFIPGTKQTIIVSNLGLIKAPPILIEKIKKMTVHANVSNKVPVNAGIISFGNVLTLNFTRKLIDPKLEFAVVNMLNELGIETYIYANARADKILKRKNIKEKKKAQKAKKV